MLISQLACIFVFLVPVLLGGCVATRSMSLQAAGPNVFAVPSSMHQGCSDARVIQLVYIGMVFDMRHAADLIGQCPLGCCWLSIRTSLAAERFSPLAPICAGGSCLTQRASSQDIFSRLSSCVELAVGWRSATVLSHQRLFIQGLVPLFPSV